MRKLASIQKILELHPIPNADAIEVATILGWHVVVKKDEFKIGDEVVYIEVDSLLPIRKEWAFLQSGGTKNMLHEGKVYTGYRLKTVKLRGQISQGICFSKNILPQEWWDNEHRKIENSLADALDDKPKDPDYELDHEGSDVTEWLGIIKYEVPVPAQMAGKMRGNFPGFIPKTDEPRIQNFPKLIDSYQGIPFYVTEKIDGSSVTFTIKNEEFHVCSRNIDLLDDGANGIWRLAKEMKIEETLQQMNKSQGSERFALQGEMYGEGIQSNPLKIKGQKIAFFNIYDFVDGSYIDYETFIGVTDLYGLPTVPVIDNDYKLPQTVDEIVEFATKRSVMNAEVWVEGYVFRPLKERSDPYIGRLSFKVINPQFLLKYEQ